MVLGLRVDVRPNDAQDIGPFYRKTKANDQDHQERRVEIIAVAAEPNAQDALDGLLLSQWSRAFRMIGTPNPKMTMPAQNGIHVASRSGTIAKSAARKTSATTHSAAMVSQSLLDIPVRPDPLPDLASDETEKRGQIDQNFAFVHRRLLRFR